MGVEGVSGFGEEETEMEEMEEEEEEIGARIEAGRQLGSDKLDMEKGGERRPRLAQKNNRENRNLE